MAEKKVNLTLVNANYTIAAYAARFVCEHEAVNSVNTITLEFPDAYTLQSFLFELQKMAVIHSKPNRLITLA